MAKTILAVAVGEQEKEVTFNTNTPDLSSVRPYIKGLKDWLEKSPQNRDNPPQPDKNPPPYQIGSMRDYIIIYRERPVHPPGSLESAFSDATGLGADLWFCMSTLVARAADSVAKAQRPTKPIVAIVSDPFSENFGNNVCGVSASRDRLAIRCLRQFKKRVREAKNIFILHREGYDPSKRAWAWIGKEAGEVIILDTDDTQTMRNKITTGIVDSPLPDKGVLVLPADRFFGVAHEITQWTGTIPTFWSTPDFPMRARGGFGYPQHRCGQYMAERVAIIWKNQAGPHVGDVIPNPKWEAMDPKDDIIGRW